MSFIRIMPVIAFGFAFALPAQAGPWCANDTRGGSNCGFQSYEQCARNIRGLGGTCQRNLDEPEGSAAAQSGAEPQDAAPPAATPVADWCAYDTLGGVNCGFQTFEQCRRNTAGLGGSCQRNQQ